MTVVGEDHEIAGHYKSIEEFHDKVFARISDTVKRESIRLEVKRVIGGGESAVSMVFLWLFSLHRTENGKPSSGFFFGNFVITLLTSPSLVGSSRILQHG